MLIENQSCQTYIQTIQEGVEAKILFFLEIENFASSSLRYFPLKKT